MPDVQIDFFGYGEKAYQPITPEILSRYNVVISIGKTVQYALGMGIPVYNYDHFGGSGYITLQNYKKEEFHNYSGRSFCRKISAREIARELTDNYLSTLEQASALRQMAIKNYLLSTHIDEIMQILQQSPQSTIAQSSENLLFIQHCKFIIEQCAVYLHQIQTLQNNINQNLHQIQTLQNNINQTLLLRQNFENERSNFQQAIDLSTKQIQKYRRKYKKYKKISLMLILLCAYFLLYSVFL